MITRQIHGDITQTQLKYIAHGVSCSRRHNSDVTKALFLAYPVARAQYNHSTRDSSPELLIDRGHAVSVAPNRYAIYAMFTQLKSGKDQELATNTQAIIKCFSTLVKAKPVGPVAVPKTGWGVEWEFAEELINTTVGDKVEIWVYE